MKDAVDSGIKSVTQMPYFEGDFWPNVLEDCAKPLDGDADQDKHSSQELTSFDETDEDSSCSSISYGEPLGKVQYSLLINFCHLFILCHIAVIMQPLCILYSRIFVYWCGKFQLKKSGPD